MRGAGLLLLLGCGRIAFDPLDGPAQDDAGSQSGTRLKFIWNEFPDR